MKTVRKRWVLFAIGLVSEEIGYGVCLLDYTIKVDNYKYL